MRAHGNAAVLLQSAIGGNTEARGHQVQARGTAFSAVSAVYWMRAW